MLCLSVVRRETRYEVQILDCVILHSRTCSFSGAPNSGYPARPGTRILYRRARNHQSRNTTHHILKSCMTTREVSVCDRSSHGLASCPDFVGEFHVLAQRSGGTTPEICPVSSDWTGAPPRWCLVVLVFGASLPQWCFCTSKPTSNRAATSTSRWRLINQRIHSQYHTTGSQCLKLSIHPDVK